ncbi:MAG: trypsin [Gammaproteobacteria bacterium]|nr:MAG: trypsin [Gammaproteobacteria bacterium]
MHKLITIFAVSFFIFIMWIIYLANTGGSSLFFDFIKSIPYGDKFGHLGLFGTLTFVSVIAFKFRSFSYRKVTIYYGAALVSLFVVAEEMSQVFIASRTFDFSDLTADAVGIVLAAGLAYLTNKYVINTSKNN